MPDRGTGAAPGGPLAGLPAAISFLTIVPVPGATGGIRWAPAWFPLVGALVGAAAGASRSALDPLVGAAPAAVVAVAVLILLTGALHVDGLADCADGAGVRGDRARRLEVMRDPRSGTFAVAAVALWLLLLVTALAGLDREHASAALIAACALGRWAALLHAVLAPPARPDGLGAGFAVATAPLAVATLIVAGAILAVLAAADALGLILTALAVAALVTVWSRRSLGGRTGDTLGLTVAVTEAVTCLAAVALWT